MVNTAHVIVPFVNSGPTPSDPGFLLLRGANGNWALPGGEVKAGETSFDALTRNTTASASDAFAQRVKLVRLLALDQTAEPNQLSTSHHLYVAKSLPLQIFAQLGEKVGNGNARIVRPAEALTLLSPIAQSRAVLALDAWQRRTTIMAVNGIKTL